MKKIYFHQLRHPLRFTLMEVLVVIAMLLLLIVAISPMLRSTMNYFDAEEMKGRLQQQCQRAEWLSLNSGREWQLHIHSNQGAGLAQLQEVIAAPSEDLDEKIPDFDSSGLYDFDGNSLIEASTAPRMFLKELPSPLFITDLRSGKQVDEATYTFLPDGTLQGPELKIAYEDRHFLLKPDRLRGVLRVLDPYEAAEEEERQQQLELTPPPEVDEEP